MGTGEKPVAFTALQGEPQTTTTTKKKPMLFAHTEGVRTRRSRFVVSSGQSARALLRPRQRQKRARAVCGDGEPVSRETGSVTHLWEKQTEESAEKSVCNAREAVQPRRGRGRISFQCFKLKRHVEGNKEDRCI